MKKIFLSNGLTVIIKSAKNTPRIALTLAFGFENPINKSGVYSVLNRLFFQGTNSRTAEDIATQLDENAIKCYSDLKHDFLRFSLLCLNEDFETGLKILSDLIFNSHFNDYEKEIFKLKGEIIADLDSPKTKAFDNFYKTIFENHFYGITLTKILESIDLIKKEDILKAYSQLMKNSYKVLTLIGDFDENEVKKLLEKYFAGISTQKQSINLIDKPILLKNKIVKIAKEDANQAQIIQGWIVPSIKSEDYPKILLLNTILGASGLSSRLFIELRDRKGLAYTVRSSYETFLKAAIFSVYIGTEPSNIKTSLEGFKTEINKLKTNTLENFELENAKNNLIGKRQFFTETNLQSASMVSSFEMQCLGFDYETELIKSIKSVTKEDIKRVANEYLKEPYVLSVLAPQKYISDL